MCGFIIHQRDHTGVNGMQAISEMSYRGLRTKYRGYKCWKEYDLLHTALPMVDPDPDIAIQPIQYDDEPPSLFVGEIYHYNQGKRTRSFDLTKAISESNSVIKIGIFDLIIYDDKNFETANWLDKKKIISGVFSEGDIIHPIEEIELSSRKEIVNEFNQRVNNKNEEGIIVRRLNGPTFKIKPTLTFDFVVLGYAMGYSDDFSLLKELIFGVLIKENTFLVVGKVSTGFSIDQRKIFSKQLEKIKVPSNFLSASLRTFLDKISR